MKTICGIKMCGIKLGKRPTCRSENKLGNYRQLINGMKGQPFFLMILVHQSVGACIGAPLTTCLRQDTLED